MTGQTDLKTLLASMKPVIQPDEFVFCTALSPAELTELKPLLTFHEKEGPTAVIRKRDIEERGLPFQYPCRQITLTVHSNLAAVGFLAAITHKLAGASISVNAVSAYYHDHLFVPSDRADEAMKLLFELVAESR